MPSPPEKPNVRINPLWDEEEFKSVERPLHEPIGTDSTTHYDYSEKYVRAAEKKLVSAAAKPPAPPRWPMLQGIWLFPFYLSTLGAWMTLSVGFMAFGWLFMFWLEYGAIGGGQTAYYVGLPALATGLLTLSYVSACSLIIIEQTSNGWNAVEIKMGIDWKDWFWDFLHILALALQAGMVGYLVQVLSRSDSYYPMAIVTLALFPLVLLGALAAEGAWAPVAILTVFRSFLQVPGSWGLFYWQTTALIGCWVFITLEGIDSPDPWVTPLYTAPLLAVVVLIYARLLGRLAGCIAKATSTSRR